MTTWQAGWLAFMAAVSFACLLAPRIEAHNRKNELRWSRDIEALGRCCDHNDERSWG